MEVKVIEYPMWMDWHFVKICALYTIGKIPKEPPSEEWKKAMLRARHSPIRELNFLFELRDIPYWVSVHLCRHLFAQPYVQSQRNDRQCVYDRRKAPQDAPINMLWSMNAEELITVANKRLCRKASEETREVVQMMCDEAIRVCPEFESELVPMCVRNGGKCYEMQSCGRIKNGFCMDGR